MDNNTLYIVVTVAFMIALAVIGIVISKGVESSEDWMVAGKSLGVIPMAGTYFATIISATSIMSYMGYYYLNGWSGWWNAAGTLMTSFLAALYFARKVRQSECNTHVRCFQVFQSETELFFYLLIAQAPVILYILHGPGILSNIRIRIIFISVIRNRPSLCMSPIVFFDQFKHNLISYRFHRIMPILQGELVRIQFI